MIVEFLAGFKVNCVNEDTSSKASYSWDTSFIWSGILSSSKELFSNFANFFNEFISQDDVFNNFEL